jgi:hypothetical protein
MDKNLETIQESDTGKEIRIRNQQAQEIYLNEIIIRYLKKMDYFVKNFILSPDILIHFYHLKSHSKNLQKQETNTKSTYSGATQNVKTNPDP